MVKPVKLAVLGTAGNLHYSDSMPSNARRPASHIRGDTFAATTGMKRLLQGKQADQAAETIQIMEP
jgi:hypothetical protein